MNSVRRITAGTIMALLVFAIWSSVTHSQDESVRSRVAKDISTAAKPGSTLTSEPQAKPGAMRAEEKLVRDVYARLMRYQSAAVDAKGDQEPGPDDYLTFELRAIHTGPIAEIYAKQLAEMVTPRDGEVLEIKPTYLRKGDDLPHGAYSAAWVTVSAGRLVKDAPVDQGSSSSKTDDHNPFADDERPLTPATAGTVGQMLRGKKGLADVTAYTSYEVTVLLDGKRRTYRALSLYHVGRALGTYQTEAERADELGRVQILDNVTAEMNTVLKDESPRMRSPWEKYSKSELYLAVMRTIKATKEAGKALIPTDAPIGYLPGDDVVATKTDMLALMVNTVCPDLRILRDSNDVTYTTQDVVVGERINLSLESNPEGDVPSNIQWTIGGNKVADYAPSTASASPTPLTNLTSPELTYYWINPGQGFEVSVTATIFGVEVTKYAHFNVAAPSPAEPTVTLPTAGHLNINNLTDCSSSTGISGPNLVFGNISGPNCTTGIYSGTAGIILSPPSTAAPPGRFFFVQLVTGDATTYSRTGATLSCTSAPGLDRDYPYQRAYALPVTDAPFVPLPSTYTTVSRTFGATMYLMWQSNTSGSIAVPMGSVGWSFSGSTTQSNASWGTPSGSGTNQPFVQASGIDSFPKWTGVAGARTCQ